MVHVCTYLRVHTVRESFIEGTKTLLKKKYLMRKNYDDHPQQFYKVFNTFLKLRSFKYEQNIEEKRFFLDFKGLKWPPLFDEIYDTQCHLEID